MEDLADDETGSMPTDSPTLPSSDEWRRLGVTGPVEIHGGKQSRVVRALIDGSDHAVKLTDRRLTDRLLLQRRMEIVDSLAVLAPEVVRPHRFGDLLVESTGAWLITATPMQRGEQLDLGDPAAGELMGAALARLHAVMTRLAPPDLPPAAALAAIPDAERSGWQLLHGDFSDQNMVWTPAGLRVFDFDDCGFGPIEYDLANSIYMVQFDAETEGRAAPFETFRPALLTGYAAASDRPIDLGAVDEMIALRIAALASWLDDLSTAPIGIRTSSPDWLNTLRSFVRSHGH